MEHREFVRLRLRKLVNYIESEVEILRMYELNLNRRSVLILFNLRPFLVYTEFLLLTETFGLYADMRLNSAEFRCRFA